MSQRERCDADWKENHEMRIALQNDFILVARMKGKKIENLFFSGRRRRAAFGRRKAGLEAARISPSPSIVASLDTEGNLSVSVAQFEMRRGKIKMKAPRIIFFLFHLL